MRDEELKAVFDKQAPGYDRQWARMAPIRDCLYFLLDYVFADLPADAQILCVGAGTGVEVAHLARQFPEWRFTVVEPSGAMLDVFRQRAGVEGFASRCDIHEGYIDSHPTEQLHDAATCFLVSQFILSPEARIAFFGEIARRLKPGGILASSDLASDVNSADYEVLLPLWAKVMSPEDGHAEGVERMRVAYAKDVAVLPPQEIASMIEAAGFEQAALFYQSGLIHAWFSRRGAGNSDASLVAWQ
jgi:tRNA (cmo5U34)-methyltransferase